MKVLQEKVLKDGREDLLGLLEGWKACRVESGGNHYFKVPGEGIIRSGINALSYLKDLARLNSGELSLAGVQHPCNPSHAHMLSDSKVWPREVPLNVRGWLQHTVILAPGLIPAAHGESAYGQVSAWACCPKRRLQTGSMCVGTSNAVCVKACLPSCC